MAKITDLSTAQTAPALTDLIHTVDVSDTSQDAAGSSKKMLLAYANKQYSGTAFPTANLWDQMPFCRTDIGTGLECFYDETNTQWLTKQEYQLDQYVGTASANGNYIQATRSDYAHFYTRYEAQISVATTNDATNYWTLTLISYDAVGGNATSIQQIVTSADGVATWTKHAGTPSTQAAPNYGVFYFNYAKTNAPGNMSMKVTAWYRLVVT